MQGVVKLNLSEFRQYRQDPTVMTELDRQAAEMMHRANSMHVTRGAVYDYAPSMRTSHGSIALVSTSNDKARVDQAAHGTLLKAVGG